jgi:hypothetical protein
LKKEIGAGWRKPPAFCVFHGKSPENSPSQV